MLASLYHHILNIPPSFLFPFSPPFHMSMNIHYLCALRHPALRHDTATPWPKRPWGQVDGCKWFRLIFSEDAAQQQAHTDPSTVIVRLLAKAVLFCAREPMFPAWTNRFWEPSGEAQVCLGTLWQGGGIEPSSGKLSLQRYREEICGFPLNALISVSQDNQPGDQKWPVFVFICHLSNAVLAHYINKHVIWKSPELTFNTNLHKEIWPINEWQALAHHPSQFKYKKQECNSDFCIKRTEINFSCPHPSKQEVLWQ